MGRRLNMLHAGMLALASGAGMASPAAAQRSVSYEEARTMPPAALARRIFGDGHTPAIDAAEVEWDPFLAFTSVTLLEPALRLGQVCARRIHFVGLAPVGGPMPEETPRTQLRVARLDSETRFGIVGATGACPVLEHGYTASYQIDDAQLAVILGRLGEARAAAAARAPLPFRIHCRTQRGETDKCGRNPRAVLAALTFEDLAWVTEVWADRCNGWTFRYAGGPCRTSSAGPHTLLGWEITLRHSAGDLSWVIGIRADQPAGMIEMEARSILFH